MVSLESDIVKLLLDDKNYRNEEKEKEKEKEEKEKEKEEKEKEENEKKRAVNDFNNSFDDWWKVKDSSTPFFTSTDLNGNKIVYAIKVNLDHKLVKKGIKCIHKNVKCNTCVHRYKNLCNLRNESGQILKFPTNTYNGENYSASETLNEVFSSVPKTKFDIDGIHIITKSPFFELEEGINVENNVPFVHYNCWPSSVSDKESSKEWEPVIKKYLPLMFNLFDLNGIPGIFASLDIIISVLPTVTYGDRLLANSVWFRKHIVENFNHRNLLDKVNIIVNALLNTPSIKGKTEADPIVTAFHQVNGTILMLLSKANNIESLKNMIAELVSPENYQRRDINVELSDKVIEIAMKELGDFTNTIMTVENSIKYGSMIIEKEEKEPINVHSSLSVLKNLKDETKKNEKEDSESKEKKGKAANFAKKVDLKNFVGKPTNLKELLENIPKDLEINCSTRHVPLIVAETTLKEKVIYPFLWGYYNSSNMNSVGLEGWQTVNAILPFPNKRSWLFSCEKPKTDNLPVGNFCIEEFLNPSIRRECGKAFAQLNVRTKPIVPKDEPLMIGIGACLRNENNFTVELEFKSPSTGTFTISSFS